MEIFPSLLFCRWTKERAVEYLLKYNIMHRRDIEQEVDRYITWPGQACAYKIGELKFKELKQKAEQQLGNFFHKAFYIHSKPFMWNSIIHN